jgi:hypothetical protein
MCVQQHVSVGMLKREENQNNIHGLPFFAILHVKTGNVFFFVSPLAQFNPGTRSYRQFLSYITQVYTKEIG